MYIYRLLPTGIVPGQEEQFHATQSRRVLEVEGSPAQELVVAFRKRTDSVSSDISPLAVTKALEEEDEPTGQPWEDLPAGKRFAITYKEDLQVMRRSFDAETSQIR